MPELAEVESSRKFVMKLFANSVVGAVSTLEQGGGPRDGLFDDLVYDVLEDHTKLITEVADLKPQLSGKNFVDALLNKRLKAVYRKGKQLWFEMEDSEIAILFHFGMTGSFVIENEAAPSYKSFKIQNKIWPPKFTKLELTFSNGQRLAFCDPRRLGKIRLRIDPYNCSPIKELALG